MTEESGTFYFQLRCASLNHQTVCAPQMGMGFVVDSVALVTGLRNSSCYRERKKKFLVTVKTSGVPAEKRRREHVTGRLVF